MHIREILDAIPHRFPFLLVDRVVEVVPGQRILAYKNVTINEEFFVGHFPQRPIMPGVLVLEAMAQAAAVLVHKTIAPNLRDADIFFMAIDGARFRRPIVPGDRLMLELTVLKQKSSVWKFRGLATVDGERAAEAELMAKWALPARGDAAPPAADSSGDEGAE
jgi:3-hydroxyacyl-[acyl-carrier-protein] dehydratase